MVQAMDTPILPVNQAQKIVIKWIESNQVSDICQSMQVARPAMRGRIFFAAQIDNEYIGIIALEIAAISNVHIDWMVIKPSDQVDVIATKLLRAAEIYCYENQYTSITLTTPSPILYEKSGYRALFETINDDSSHAMVYMQKILSLNDFTFIDLTHALSPDVPHWGIDVGFKYNARFIQGADSNDIVKFRVQRLEMSSGIGTHMDAPSHCFEEGAAIDAIPIQSLITNCRVIDVSSQAHEQYRVSLDDIIHFESEYGVIPKGSFVIIYTGWDQRWPQPERYRNNKVFPSLSVEAAKHLLSRDIVGIGIDTLSPDAFGSNFPVHSLILGAGKYIVENVANAKQLDPIGSYIFALPIKITDGTEAPMRLIGMMRK